MTLPLDGVLVADFSRVLAGPLAAATLADLGATVIKVERPGLGDDTRSWGPPWSGTSSSYFESANRSKKSVELDLDDPEDLRLAQELAARCDVLIENFRTGTLDRRGLGYEQVAAGNPGVVYVSVTGFGSHGGAALAGYDFLVQAVGGLMSITGQVDEPTRLGRAGRCADVEGRGGRQCWPRYLARERSGHRSAASRSTSFRACSPRSPTRHRPTLRRAKLQVAMGNRHPSIAPYQTLSEPRTGPLAVVLRQ